MKLSSRVLLGEVKGYTYLVIFLSPSLLIQGTGLENCVWQNRFSSYVLWPFSLLTFVVDGIC